MRILILRHGHYPQDPRVRREAAALVARGHAVDVVCLRDHGQAPREVVDGVTVRRLPVAHRREGAVRYLWEYGAFGAGAAWAATVTALRGACDVVQVNTMPDALVFAALVPRLLGVPVVLDFHELMPELYASKFATGMRHPWPRVLAWLERRAASFADACLAVSDPVLDRYVSRGLPRDKFTVVMNAPDLALFRRDPTRTAAGDGASAGADGPARIVSHGTLVARYGFDVLVRALAEVPDAQLDIVGDGEARGALERLAADIGVAGRVTFAGRLPLEDVPGRLAGATIGVVANRSDPFTDLVVPTKLMEYVALGIPAIVARTPAVAAYFDARMVTFFTPGAPDDLARALRALIADPARRAAQAGEARRAFQSSYGWPAMAERYVGLIEKLGGKAERRGRG